MASSPLRVASLAVAHSPSLASTRASISAAAFLVNVRHRIERGSAPVSRSRRMRCTRMAGTSTGTWLYSPTWRGSK